MQISSTTERHILSYVRRDLVPGNTVAYAKTGVAMLAGGTISLFLCGQFGMGLTGAARHVNHAIHHGVGPVGCAFICGALFAIVPALVLRMLSSPVQFRVLMRKKWQPQVAWLAGIGSLLSYHGSFGFEAALVAAWLVAAIVVYRLAGLSIDLSLAQVHGLKA